MCLDTTETFIPVVNTWTVLFTVTAVALSLGLNGDLSSDTVICPRLSEDWVRCFKCSSVRIQELEDPTHTV